MYRAGRWEVPDPEAGEHPHVTGTPEQGAQSQVEWVGDQPTQQEQGHHFVFGEQD